MKISNVAGETIGSLDAVMPLTVASPEATREDDCLLSTNVLLVPLLNA